MAILQSGYTDASRTNASSRSTRLYRDIALSFETNAATKDVIVKKDVDAVKQSVKNLILTNHFERPFHPEIGSGITNLLFEPLDPITANSLSRVIGEVITNFEPRAQVVSVDARPNAEANSYEVTIDFRVINVPGELVSLTTKKIRSNRFRF
jgi:phage baseplate assembly protein W